MEGSRTVSISIEEKSLSGELMRKQPRGRKVTILQGEAAIVEKKSNCRGLLLEVGDEEDTDLQQTMGDNKG